MKLRRDLSEQGSALMYVLITITVLLSLTAATLRPVSDQFASTYHTAAWQEALLAAEAGVDVATIQLRRMIADQGMLWPHIDWINDPTKAPATAWPSPWTFSGGKHRASQTFSHTGQGGTLQKVDVVVDAPPDLKDPVSGWQYYRIRSTGTLYMNGSNRAGGDKRDLGLRKFSLKWKRPTGDPEQDKDLPVSGTPLPVAQPQVTRTIEVIVRPSSGYPVALLSRNTTTFNNHNVVVDSYDSSDPTKSTNGQYDVNKRQQHGDVATNGVLIAAGDAHIYGNVSTNGGTVTGISNITGVIRDDFYQDLPPAPRPTWTAFTPVTVSGSATTLLASPVKGVARYKVPGFSLSGGSKLTLTKAAGSTQVNHIEIWVTGNMSFSGNAALLLSKDVIATIYVDGDMDIGGNGVGNADTVSTGYERPANLLIYGLPQADGTQLVKLHGNADIEAGVYAPDADVEIKGGGSSGDFSGSVVGKTIFMNGVTQAHYDEAMGRRGAIVGFRIASWVEDIR